VLTYFQANPSFHGTPAKDVGSSAMIEVIVISATATMHIHLYRLPRVHVPVWNDDPARQRRKIGMANATYKPTTPIDTTAKNATGTGAPPMSTFTRAGSVRTTATMAERTTPYTGTLLALSLDQYWPPGTAPSRLNANNIRVVLVMQATVQKNWPAVEIRSTVPAQFEDSAWLKMTTTSAIGPEPRSWRPCSSPRTDVPTRRSR